MRGRILSFATDNVEDLVDAHLATARDVVVRLGLPPDLLDTVDLHLPVRLGGAEVAA